MLEEHILPSLNGLCCQRTCDDDERLGLCTERMISEGKIGTVQYVNRRQGCGLVQFSLFFLLKTWPPWHLVMKMNHMQLFAPIAHGMVAGLSCGGMKMMLVLALPSAGVWSGLEAEASLLQSLLTSLVF